jgi:hypothetical protein
VKTRTDTDKVENANSVEGADNDEPIMSTRVEVEKTRKLT